MEYQIDEKNEEDLKANMFLYGIAYVQKVEPSRIEKIKSWILRREPKGKLIALDPRLIRSVGGPKGSFDLELI